MAETFGIDASGHGIGFVDFGDFEEGFVGGGGGEGCFTLDVIFKVRSGIVGRIGESICGVDGGSRCFVIF